MKKILVLFLLCVPAFATNGLLVQSKTHTATSATQTIQFTNSVLPGDTVVAVIQWQSSSITISSVTANTGDTVTCSTPTGDGSTYQAETCYVTPVGGVNVALSLTWNMSSSVVSQQVAAEFSGIALTSSHDQTCQAHQASTTSPTCTTGATGQATELVVESFAAKTTSTTYTASGGFTSIASTQGVNLSYQFVTSTGTQVASATSSSDDIVTEVHTFKLTTDIGWGRQGNTNGTGSATTIPCAFPTNVASGGLLYLNVSWSDATNTVSSVADSLSQTWTQVNAVVTEGTGPHSQQSFYFANSAAGANTVTVTFSAAPTTARISCMELANMATASPLDGTPTTAASVSAATTLTVGGMTTTNANDVLVLGCGSNGSQGTIAWVEDAGYSGIPISGRTGGEWKTVTSSGAQSSVTCHASSDRYVATFAAFKTLSGAVSLGGVKIAGPMKTAGPVITQ